MMKRLGLLWALLSFSLIFGCHEAPVDGPPEATVQAIIKATGNLTREELAGKTLYTRYCLICHGESGAGDGFNARDLSKALVPLAERIRELGDKGLAAHVDRGVKEIYRPSECPPYGGNLSNDERRILIAYVSQLTQEKESRKPPGSKAPPEKSGP